jgi:DNA-directed RNA polymerase I, II, and III subunit RPABC1
MHILQPKHTKLKQNEAKELLEKLNISITQLPFIKKTDAALPMDCKSGDVIKIDRKSGDTKITYYRVVE